MIRYTSAYHMNRILTLNRAYRTIHRHGEFKMSFFFGGGGGLKFMFSFDLNKLLDFF